MRQATIRSVCECEAKLEALLDERGLVLAGWAACGGGKKSAPAHTMGPGRPTFQIGWLCPLCGRNTMRSFAADTLEYRDGPEPAARYALSRESP